MPKPRFAFAFIVALALAGGLGVVAPVGVAAADRVKDLQTAAIKAGKADWGFWGYEPAKYTGWKSHSNRLIPIYTFGMTLDEVRGAEGEKSPYRNAARLRQLYGTVPKGTLNPQAQYFDQTDVYRLQVAAHRAGKKNVILIIFDGMDWQTTWAAAIYKTQKVVYRAGRGTGLHFQDYGVVDPTGTTADATTGSSSRVVTDFGYFCTSPHNDGSKIDVDAQIVINIGGKTPGGFDPRHAGDAPWSLAPDRPYPVSKSTTLKHAYTDSASSATSMNAGIKTFNEAINVDYRGQQVMPIARMLQQKGIAIGVVSSVPISHATPAATYANNVSRDDYQDLTRDMVGLKSVSHRVQALPGVDVLLGAGWGEVPTEKTLKDTHKNTRKEQGANYIPGNIYLTDADRKRIDASTGGNYLFVERTPGFRGGEMLAAAAREARSKKQRLLGFFGQFHENNKSSHLPFRTADGAFDPTIGVDKKAQKYTPEDISENPTLSDMAQAALTVLSANDKGFWLMIEAGDVDWGNHDDNIDNSIGAVLSGDDAFRGVTQWIDAHDAWRDTVVIVTADHGHYLHLVKPEALAAGE